MQDTNSQPQSQEPERIPGELDADYRARCRRMRRSVKWVGRGSRRHRKVYRSYGHRPIIDQNEERIVSVEKIGRVEAN